MVRVGDTVLYQLEKGRSAGALRPAIVVDVKELGATIQVFNAATLDAGSECEKGSFSGILIGVREGTTPGTYRQRTAPE